jgi:anti-anti-sigma factor
MIATLRMETLRETPVAWLSGEVDASNASELGAQIMHSVPNTAMGLVLDLSETDYLDSSGIQLLFELADRLRRRQQELRLVVPAESFVGDVLAAVNFGGAAQTDTSVDRALAALKAQPPG